MTQERVNYCILEDGTHVAHFVNHPITVQAYSFDDMQAKVAEMFNVYISHLIELNDQENPFEFKEYTVDFEKYKNDTQKETNE